MIYLLLVAFHIFHFFTLEGRVSHVASVGGEFSGESPERGRDEDPNYASRDSGGSMATNRPTLQPSNRQDIASKLASLKSKVRADKMYVPRYFLWTCYASLVVVESHP